MMNFKKHIPNLFTFLNMFCGCLALCFIMQSNFVWGFYLVCLGIFFDFFDGFFARLFKVESPLGVQLDSLADMITSGLVPGFVMFFMIKDTLGNSSSINNLIPFLGFTITIASGFRLAKFNIDSRQTHSFIGLPTPANSLFICSLPIVLKESTNFVITGVLIDTWALVLITLLSSYILNSSVKLFSLKIKSSHLKDYLLPIIFLILAFLLLLFFKIVAVPAIIFSYIIASLLFYKEKI